MTSDLFYRIELRTGGREQIGDGAYILRGRDLTWKGQLLATIDAVSSLSPSRHTVTPDGYTMSASIMNCVEHGAGSLTDADTGTPPDDHATGRPSPSMPRRGRSACGLAAAEADCNRSSSSPMIRCHSFSSERLPRSYLGYFGNDSAALALELLRAAFSLRAVQRYWRLPPSPWRRRNLNLVISFDAVRDV